MIPLLSTRALRLATRGSALALAQSELVVQLLRRHWRELEVSLHAVSTYGDRHRETPLAELRAPDGVFTRAVELELVEGRADFAVHSLKDLPTATDPSLLLAAFPVRADPRDALVSSSGQRFDDLPSGAVVGTSSPRRAAQILAQRPDLQTRSIRGNVDTRLRKLRDGEYDALVLASAGLERLGRLTEAVELLPVDRFTPAVGQGALAVQCQADDARTTQLLAAVDDPATRAAVTAERVFLRLAGGGCRIPLAAHGVVEDGRLRLNAFVASPDGRRAAWAQLDGPAENAEHLGLELRERLLETSGGLLAELLHG